MKRRGLTIVEVLVVIAIIAILVGLMVPAINAVLDAKNPNPAIKTVKIETGEWRQITTPMVWNDNSLLYTTMEIEGRRYLIVTKPSAEGGVAVVPILPAQAERD